MYWITHQVKTFFRDNIWESAPDPLRMEVKALLRLVSPIKNPVIAVIAAALRIFACKLCHALENCIASSCDSFPNICCRFKIYRVLSQHTCHFKHCFHECFYVHDDRVELSTFTSVRKVYRLCLRALVDQEWDISYK